MINNDYLRSIRYAMDISDAKMSDIFGLAGKSVAVLDVKAFLKNEEDEGYVKCDDDLMAHFLTGLIYFKRGKDESRPVPPLELPIDNNIVLKKLRVAFELKEEDMHEILKLSGFSIGRSELSAFLRKKGHVNYRECGDQVMRNFLKGLSIRMRG